MTILDLIKKDKIIAIVRGISLEKILPTCEALHAGGVNMIEVTFNQSSPTGNEDTYNSIKKISNELGDKICVGAGTVMTVEQVELAVKAGAKYIISPNYNEDVVKKSIELNVVPLPGVLTPSEGAEAFKIGAPAIKIFPVGNFGPGYMKAMSSPLSHIPMLAVGGVDLSNAADYIKAGAIGLGLGSSLVNSKLINAGKFSELTKLAEQFVEAVNI